MRAAESNAAKYFPLHVAYLVMDDPAFACAEIRRAEGSALYDGRRKVGSALDQIEVMGLLTTIASINNYNLGNWR